MPPEHFSAAAQVSLFLLFTRIGVVILVDCFVLQDPDPETPPS